MDEHGIERLAGATRAGTVEAERNGWIPVAPLAHSRLFSLAIARPAGCENVRFADYVIKQVRWDTDEPLTALRLLAREVEVSRDVAHPHLATILAAELSGTPPFIVRPYYDGASARELSDRSPRRHLRHLLWWSRQVAEALAALHERGWVHGDIKPENIIVSPTGHVTLIDLGFACRPDGEDPPLAPLLQASLAYAAPELIAATFGMSAKADIYGLGVTLFELLTGELPFKGTAEQLARAHVEQPAPDPRRLVRDLPSHVARLVQRLLSKQPEHRPTASELVEKLFEYEIMYFAS